MYRGVENPFGYLRKLTDGAKIFMQSNGGSKEFYVCHHKQYFGDSCVANYTLKGVVPMGSGYIKVIVLGEAGDILPMKLSAGSTSFFCDYFNNGATGGKEYILMIGGF